MIGTTHRLDAHTGSCVVPFLEGTSQTFYHRENLLESPGPYHWALTSKCRNKLAHALNGNGSTAPVWSPAQPRSYWGGQGPADPLTDTSVMAAWFVRQTPLDDNVKYLQHTVLALEARCRFFEQKHATLSSAALPHRPVDCKKVCGHSHADFQAPAECRGFLHGHLESEEEHAPPSLQRAAPTGPVANYLAGPSVVRLHRNGLGMLTSVTLGPPGSELRLRLLGTHKAGVATDDLLVRSYRSHWGQLTSQLVAVGQNPELPLVFDEGGTVKVDSTLAKTRCGHAAADFGPGTSERTHAARAVPGDVTGCYAQDQRAAEVAEALAQARNDAVAESRRALSSRLHLVRPTFSRATAIESAAGAGFSLKTRLGSFYVDKGPHCWVGHETTGELRDYRRHFFREFWSEYVFTPQGLLLVYQNQSPFDQAKMAKALGLTVSELEQAMPPVQAGFTAHVVYAPSYAGQARTATSYLSAFPPTMRPDAVVALRSSPTVAQVRTYVGTRQVNWPKIQIGRTSSGWLCSPNGKSSMLDLLSNTKFLVHDRVL